LLNYERGRKMENARKEKMRLKRNDWKKKLRKRERKNN
jgi:hypothetical protein